MRIDGENRQRAAQIQFKLTKFLLLRFDCFLGGIVSVNG